LIIEAEAHIRDEYSTYDWVMEGLLNRAGFCIDKAEYADGYGATYVYTWQRKAKPYQKSDGPTTA
jgi:hypothetical protein